MAPIPPVERLNSDPAKSRRPENIRAMGEFFRGGKIMLRSIGRASALAFFLVNPFVEIDAAVAKPTVDVAFVLDTTGSMARLIEGAKRKIWSIATSIVDSNPDAEIRMGLVAYRDIGDVYVTKTFNLTTDIQDLYGKLLELRAQGGGDWPESVNEALDIAVNKLDWDYGRDATRIIFLVGDAPPHMDYAQDTKYPAVMRMAQQKDIIVNTVQAGTARDTARIWRDIAQLGQGEYIPIPQDGGVIVMIETPYDGDIIELQGQINRTVVPYGPRAQRLRVEEKSRQIAAAPRSAASDMASYLNKRAQSAPVAEAVTGGGDLVADVKAGRARLGSLKDAELPDNLRTLAPTAREKFLSDQLERRNTLNERLSGLIQKRDQFLQEARKKTPAKTADSFDRVVEQTLRAQIKR
jgi:Mg-chelatase subunit ChlD